MSYTDPFGLWPDWGRIKGAIRDWARHVRRNWDKWLPPLANPGDALPHPPTPEDIDMTPPPPGEERPVRDEGGTSGKPGGSNDPRRIPGKDGKPGIEIKWERIPRPSDIIRRIWNWEIPVTIPEGPGIQPWMFPSPFGPGAPIIVPGD